MKVRITQTQRDRLCELRATTELNPIQVLMLADGALGDLKAGTIKKWMSGKEKLASIGLVDKVIEFWSSIPEQGHIEWPKSSMIECLRSYLGS